MAKLTFRSCLPSGPTKLTTARKRLVSQHDRMIEEFCREFPDARRRGFGTEVRRILAAVDLPSGFGVVPDAYVVHPDIQEIYAYEAVDGCRVTAEKRALYVNLGFALNEADWSLGLIIEDVGGSRRVHDVVGEYIEAIAA